MEGADHVSFLAQCADVACDGVVRCFIVTADVFEARG